MAARAANIAFDCDDVLKLADFWSVILDRPLDKGSSEFFASIGGADGERREPAWYFNKVPESKKTKNRVHIDLVDSDPDAVDKLVRPGGAGQDRPDSHQAHSAAVSRSFRRTSVMFAQTQRSPSARATAMRWCPSST